MSPLPDAPEGRPGVVGIVNVTPDSFSDGGRWLEPAAAVAHALRLVSDGADAIELGAASSHPDAAPVAPEEEIRRLAPVLDALVTRGVAVGVDSFTPAVQRLAAARGAAFVNDIQGFADAEALPALRDAGCTLVVMHSVQRRGAATRAAHAAPGLVAGIEAFFAERTAFLAGLGFGAERVVLDPGMGFFLGSAPEASLAVLRELGHLRACFGRRLLVSVSRKSFLGTLTGRETAERGAATLAAELFAAARGADWIRTHDVRALRDGLAVMGALGPARVPQPVIPTLRTGDMARSRAFYVGGLGFRVDFEHRHGPGLPLFVQLSRHGLVLRLSEHAGDGACGALVHLYVPDVDAWWQRARDVGAATGTGPVDQPWGDRELRFSDPDGNQLCVSTRGAR
jgi:dihydropteroate synthase type 2